MIALAFTPAAIRRLARAFVEGEIRENVLETAWMESLRRFDVTGDYERFDKTDCAVQFDFDDVTPLGSTTS